jgi:hypothetical protein
VRSALIDGTVARVATADGTGSAGLALSARTGVSDLQNAGAFDRMRFAERPGLRESSAAVTAVVDESIVRLATAVVWRSLTVSPI